MQGSSTTTAAQSSASDCDRCPIAPNRRVFIAQSTVAIGAAFVAVLGLSSEAAQALSMAGTAVGRALGASVTYPIPEKDGVQIDKDNGVILVRWLGSVYAFALSCPHQNTSLAWLEKDERFQCPKHRSQYSADGYFISGRATRGMDRYGISRKDKAVVVDLAVLKKESDDKKGWEATCVTL